MDNVNLEKSGVSGAETPVELNLPFDSDLGVHKPLSSAPQNTSGRGKFAELPPGVAGWSWGALFLNWIWAIGNKTWIGLFCAIPYIGIIGSIYLGFHGRELAWQNKKWDSVEHFNAVQRKWSIGGVAIVSASILIGIVSALVGI